MPRSSSTHARTHAPRASCSVRYFAHVRPCLWARLYRQWAPHTTTLSTSLSSSFALLCHSQFVYKREFTRARPRELTIDEWWYTRMWPQQHISVSWIFHLKYRCGGFACVCWNICVCVYLCVWDRARARAHLDITHKLAFLREVCHSTRSKHRSLKPKTARPF